MSKRSLLRAKAVYCNGLLFSWVYAYVAFNFKFNPALYEVLNHPTYHIGWGKVFRFAVQMARAVLYLHSLSPEIIHGGIQSKNILVYSNL